MTALLVSIFDYFDYQKYLRDYLAARKQQDAYFTYRFLAGKAGIDHAFIVKIFQGQKHLSLKLAPIISEILKHDKREGEYFELLILFSRTKSDRESKMYFEKLLGYVEFSPLKIEGSKYEFYQKWFYAAVREVIGIAGFDGDYARLARSLRPAITEAQARKAVSLLLELGLIEKQDENYRPADRFLSASEAIRPLAVRQFQKETMLLAIDALETIDKAEREISTVTLSLSRDGADKIKESLRNFRTELMRIANQDRDVTGAFQINLQLFPISRTLKGVGHEAA